MKRALLIYLCALYLHAFDENTLMQEIQNTKSIEELFTQMQYAPKEYRHHYIQAIKERAQIENESNREQLMSEISAEKVQTIHEKQINTLTGKNSNANSSGSGSGSGSGNGGGSGGHGGGKGGK